MLSDSKTSWGNFEAMTQRNRKPPREPTLAERLTPDPLYGELGRIGRRGKSLYGDRELVGCSTLLKCPDVSRRISLEATSKEIAEAARQAILDAISKLDGRERLVARAIFGLDDFKGKYIEKRKEMLHPQVTVEMYADLRPNVLHHVMLELGYASPVNSHSKAAPSTDEGAADDSPPKLSPAPQSVAVIAAQLHFAALVAIASKRGQSSDTCRSEFFGVEKASSRVIFERYLWLANMMSNLSASDSQDVERPMPHIAEGCLALLNVVPFLDPEYLTSDYEAVALALTSGDTNPLWDGSTAAQPVPVRNYLWDRWLIWWLASAFPETWYSALMEVSDRAYVLALKASKREPNLFATAEQQIHGALGKLYPQYLLPLPNSTDTVCDIISRGLDPPNFTHADSFLYKYW